MKDLVSKQGEVNEIIDDGNHFIDDEALPDTQRKKVHEKMVILHDDWNKLANLTSGKQQRLVWGVAVVQMKRRMHVKPYAQVECLEHEVPCTKLSTISPTCWIRLITVYGIVEICWQLKQQQLTSPNSTHHCAQTLPTYWAQRWASVGRKRDVVGTIVGIVCTGLNTIICRR